MAVRLSSGEKGRRSSTPSGRNKTGVLDFNSLTPSGPQNLTTFVYGGFVDIWIREMDSSAFSPFLLTVGGQKREINSSLSAMNSRRFASLRTSLGKIRFTTQTPCPTENPPGSYRTYQPGWGEDRIDSVNERRAVKNRFRESRTFFTDSDSRKELCDHL
ncbi:hypothetical protein AVEN_144286-1 [Araneus ventricosus]|uniref:Uncharacterized protein n=1 Tax=Araneus ventricosus TaxID=182803 RepID=A0A4Y2JXG2_ARAVE|nr:hypothetical protein AVEN_144286-1 [Araneus ventricosus]